MRAVQNKAIPISVYYAGAPLTTPRARVYDATDTLVVAVTLVPSAYLANVYLADPDEDYPVITRSGSYYIKYEHNPSTWTVFDYEALDVQPSHSTDIRVSTTVSPQVSLGEDEVGDTGSTVELTILTHEDARINTSGDYTYVATYTAAQLAYVATPPPFENEGIYFLLWYDDSVLIKVDRVQTFIPRDRELVELFFGEVVGSATVPHASIDVLVSDEDMDPIEQGITNSSGYVSFSLPPGDYVISIRKTGVVFSTNNYTLSVIDTDTEVGENSFSKEVEAVIPTWSDSSPPAGASLCTLYVQLYDIFGSPIRRVDVLVSPAQGPGMFSGTGTFGGGATYTTDANGYVEFSVVQGTILDITITGFALRRRITVPSSAGPTNLLTLLSAASDMFDIINVTVPSHDSRAV